MRDFARILLATKQTGFGRSPDKLEQEFNHGHFDLFRVNAAIGGSDMVLRLSCRVLLPFAGAALILMSQAPRSVCQTAPASGAADSLKACGPGDISYNVSSAKTTSQKELPKPGMALIYFIQDDGSAGNHQHFTTKVAIDGSWIGAYKQNAYFAISIPAGEHHICANVQSSQTAGQNYAFAHLNAQAGKTYYFRTQFFGGLYPVPRRLDLNPLDRDEATYLIASYPQSVATPKK